jgi:hypothetical protein
MIKEVNERCMYIEIMHKKLIHSVNKIRKNARIGLGSDAISSSEAFDTLPIYAGKLQEHEKNKGKSEKKDGAKKAGKKSKEDDKLASYFSNMESKSKMTMTNAKLQRKLDENKKRREKMKAQFGQFTSFPAAKLLED